MPLEKFRDRANPGAGPHPWGESQLDWLLLRRNDGSSSVSVQKRDSIVRRSGMGISEGGFFL